MKAGTPLLGSFARSEDGSEFHSSAQRFQPTISLWRRQRSSNLRVLPPVLDEEDEETLAAIDEGIRDTKASRTIPPRRPLGVVQVDYRLPNTKRALNDLAGIIGHIAESAGEKLGALLAEF